jgi:hypothetical protein
MNDFPPQFDSPFLEEKEISEVKEIKGLSLSSVLGLKSELSKRQALHEQEKQRFGSQISSVQLSKLKGMKKQVKQVSNRGIESRNQKDISEMVTESSQMEASWSALQRKAEKYDMIKEGRMRDDLKKEDRLVDFTQKRWQEDDADEDRTVKKKRAALVSASATEWVEITDEFGRDRLVRKEEAEFIKASAEKQIAEERTDNYQEEEHVQDAEYHQDRIELPERSIPKHFDSSRERRYLGAGHFQFDVADVEKRQQQFQDINELRIETITNRDKQAVAKMRRKEKLDDRTRLLQERARKRKDQVLENVEESAEDILNNIFK